MMEKRQANDRAAGQAGTQLFVGDPLASEFPQAPTPQELDSVGS